MYSRRDSQNSLRSNDVLSGSVYEASTVTGTTGNKMLKTDAAMENGLSDDDDGRMSVSSEVSAKLTRMLSDTSEQENNPATSYSGEWCKLFSGPRFMDTLKQEGIDGSLRSCRFRSLCWKLYLQVLPENQDQWIFKTRHWRNKYKELKQTLIVNPRKNLDNSDLSVNNPLSQENESPWNQFFQDNELRVTIKQDVIRTFPEVEFYQNTLWQNTMVNILFCCAKQFSRLSYRQGMHELLAPLIFVLHCDHQAFLHACEIETIGLVPQKDREVLHEIMDPEYIEHDAYAMFYQIMETVEPWYVSKEISPIVRMNNILSAQPFTKFQDLHPSNVIITKLTRIQDYLLKKADPELHEHLTSMDIPPQIYGIRWVRLLFGREFPMQDLLMLWDAIFADGISFDLVDYIFVAMLLYLRDAMMTSDYPSCLQLLMRFPQVGDVHYFVTKAMYLREPNENPVPPVYSYQKPHTPSSIDGDAVPLSKTKGKKSMMGTLSRFTRKNNSGRPRTLSVSDNSTVSRSTSEPMNLITDSDQSPMISIPHSRDRRKGSTASLSKLESVRPYQPADLPSSSPAHSMVQLETSSVRSDTAATTSRSDLARAETASLPSRRFSSLPRGSSKKGKRAQERNLEYDLAILMARLNDMETMCRKCSDCMDSHIYKLQSEMMSQNIDNEDELLLALAGLKQVRDVLRGTLKPSSLFENEEIKIRENHYKEDSPPSKAVDSVGSRASSGAVTPSLDSRDGATGEQYYVATPDLLSDTDLQTPDTDDTGNLIVGNDEPMVMSATYEPSPVRSHTRNASFDSSNVSLRGDHMPRDFVPAMRRPVQPKSVEMSERLKSSHGIKRRTSSDESFNTAGSMDECLSSDTTEATDSMLHSSTESYVRADELEDTITPQINFTARQHERSPPVFTNYTAAANRANQPNKESTPMNKLAELFKSFPKF